MNPSRVKGKTWMLCDTANAGVDRDCRPCVCPPYATGYLPFFRGAWARSLPATRFSGLVDPGFERILPASLAGFFPVAIGNHTSFRRNQSGAAAQGQEAERDSPE